MNNLKTLDLEGNTITSITSNNDVKFDQIDIDLLLGNNKIQELLAGAFDSFKKFNRLDLSYNQVINKYITMFYTYN